MLLVLLLGASSTPGAVLTFREGENGYVGTFDTQLRFATASTAHGNEPELLVDGSDGTPAGPSHGLIRFENLFGFGPRQIPPGQHINAVTLTLRSTTMDAATPDQIFIHPLFQSWGESSTWNNSFGANGVQADNLEAASSPQAVFTANQVVPFTLVINLSPASVQAWSDGSVNLGWVLLPTGTDGYRFRSSEEPVVSDRPLLTIDFGSPQPPAITRAPASTNVLQGRSATLVVEATGSLPLHYQWLRSGDFLPDATNSTFSITNMTQDQQGSYAVRVSNPAGFIDSPSAFVGFIPDVDPPQPVYALGWLDLIHVTVLFSEPIEPGSVDFFSFVVETVDGTSSLLISQAVVTSPTNVTLQTEPRSEAVPYRVRVEGISDPYGNVSVGAEVLLHTEQRLLSVVNPTTWRFNQNDVDPGPAWRGPFFADGSWAAGLPLFAGVRGGPPPSTINGETVRTTLTVTNALGSNIPTVYFRTHFQFSGDLADSRLKLRPFLDDGGAVYLNGQEAFRIGLPAGSLSHTTLANRTIVTASYEGPFDLPVSNLLQGDNVLAVELHQVLPTSSDLTFGLELIAEVPAPSAPSTSTLSISRAGASVSVHWTGADYQLQATTNLNPGCAINWQTVPGVSPLTLPASGSNRFFRTLSTDGQRFSLNAVGYVNLTLNGIQLIANPLNAVNNSLDVVLPPPPGPLVVDRLKPNGEPDQYVYDPDVGGWSPFAPVLNPGEGFFLNLGSPGSWFVTFVGEVPQGLLANPVPGNSVPSLRASTLPVSARLGDPARPGTLQFPAAAGDTVFPWDPATGQYLPAYTYSPPNGWSSPQDTNPDGPFIPMGRSFRVVKAGAAAQWLQTLDANHPAPDTTPPVLTLLGANPLTLQCHTVFADPGATAVDACAGNVTSRITVSGTVNTNAVGTNVVVYRVDDGANTSSVTRVVRVVDTIPPVFTVCPPARSAPGIGPSWQAPVPDFRAQAALSDACGVVSLTQLPAPGTLAGFGVLNVALSATDGGGNTATCNTTFTVTDNVPPTITCPPTLTVGWQPPAGPQVIYPPVTVTDNCDPSVPVVFSRPSGSVFPLGSTPVTATATDRSGNSNSCSFTVRVVDQTPPGIVCPPDAIGEWAGPQGTTVTFAAPVVTDDCDPNPTVVCSPLSGTLFPFGDTLVTCTARDLSGNANTCSFRVRVRDTMPPVIGQPRLTVILNGAADGFVGPEPASPSPALVQSLQGAPALSFDAFVPGRTFIHTIPQLPECITGVELEIPLRPFSPQSAPATITLGPALADLSAPKWTRYLGTSPGNEQPGLLPQPWLPGVEQVFTLNFARLPNADGTTTALIAALNAGRSIDFRIQGDTAVDYVRLRVNNALCREDLIVPAEPGMPGARVLFGDPPRATDNRDPNPLVSVFPANGSFFAIGNTPVEYRAVDSAGNIGQCWFTVRVRDLEPPILFCSNLLIRCTKPIAVFYSVPAFDNSGQPPAVSCAPPPGTVFRLGPTPVQCIGVDAAGNVASCQFLVEVEGPLPPALRFVDFSRTNFALSFNTEAARHYAVEYKAALTDLSWNLLAEVTGNGRVMTVTDSSGSSPSRFYRVRDIDPSLPGGAPSVFESPPDTPPAQPGSPSAHVLAALFEGLDLSGPENGAVCSRPGPGLAAALPFGGERTGARTDSALSDESPEAAPALSSPKTSSTGAADCAKQHDLPGQPYVYLHSGEFHLEQTDLCIPGRGLDFHLRRKYRSCICLLSPVGWQWDHSYNICILPTGPNVILFDGNTRQDTLVRQPDDTFVADQFFREGRFDDQARFHLIFGDGGAWEFYPLDGRPEQGRIEYIRDRNGNRLHFTYDEFAHLTNVNDTLTRDIQFSYNSNGLLSVVKDFTGREVHYRYYQNGDEGGGFGDLQSVVWPAVTNTPHANDFPFGQTNVFTYSQGSAIDQLNHNLLTVTDAKGQAWLQNTYVLPEDDYCDRVVRQVRGYPNEVLRFDYSRPTPDPANNLAVRKTIVNDRVGNVSEHFFDAGNRLVLSRAWTGRAVPDVPTTEDGNRPKNRLRTSDPAFFEIRLSWNVDSLPTRLVFPNGNSVENTYELELNANAPRRSRGNLRVRRGLPGPLGGDQPELVEQYEYADGVGGCCGFNFVTKAVDARGHVAFHSYDERGNRLRTQHRLASSIDEFGYNEFGQLTSHTWPDNGSGHRRVDQFIYYETDRQRGYLAQAVRDVTARPATNTFEYDPVGNVIRTVDPNGGDTLYTLNALNQVVLETSRPVQPGATAGVRYRRWRLYDANRNLVRIDDENRDDAGVLQSNTRFSRLYEYDILNQVTRTVTERGDVNLSDAVHTLENIPFAQRRECVVQERAYDANRNVILTRSGEATAGRDPFNVVARVYDERDLLFREVRAPGSALQSSIQRDYDGNRNLRRVNEGLEDAPRAWGYVCDGFNRLTRRSDPMGNLTTHHYDPNHNCLSTRLDGELLDGPGSAGNRRLAEIFHQYDAMDRRVRTDRAFFDLQTQQPIGDGFASAVLAYSENSQVTRITDDGGGDTLITYNTANRTNIVTDAAGNSVTWAYDRNGNTILVTEQERSDAGGPAQAFATSYAYDGLDRLIAVVDSARQTNRFAYDSRNARRWVSDPRGNVTRHTYDGLVRLVETRRLVTDTGDGQGLVVGTNFLRQVWDDSCRLLAAQDDPGHITRFAYDALNRRVATRMADGTLQWVGTGALDWPENQERPLFTDVFQNGFDVHNNPLAVTDPNGTVIVASFDALNRILTHAITPAAAGGVGGASYETFSFNGLGLVTAARNDYSLVTRDYDSLCQLVREGVNLNAPGFPSASDYVTTWSHDALGHATGCVYPDGTQTGYTYDAIGRLRQVCQGACGAPGSVVLANYSYVGPARLLSLALGNGTRGEFGYDAGRRSAMVLHRHTASGVVLDQRTNTWDAASNKSRETDLRPSGPARDRRYTYDSLGRLMRSVATVGAGVPELDTGYTLDGAGNRLQVRSNGVARAYVLDATLPEPADAQVNQYTQTPFSSHQYQRNGNLLEELRGSERTRFEYDHANRLARILDASSGLAVPMVTYVYDALGRRLARTLTPASPASSPAPAPPLTTLYFHDGARVIQEREGGAVTVNNFWAPSSELLAFRRGAVFTYVHADDLGSVRVLSDASGQAIERYEYGDFGEVRFLDPAGTGRAASIAGNKQLFRGLRLDDESGFYSVPPAAMLCVAGRTMLSGEVTGVPRAFARLLDPEAGRYLTRNDPARWFSAQALGNAYTFAGNNPLRPDPLRPGAILGGFDDCSSCPRLLRFGCGGEEISWGPRLPGWLRRCGNACEEGRLPVCLMRPVPCPPGGCGPRDESSLRPCQ